MMRRSTSLLQRGRFAAQCNVNQTLAANTAVACAPSTLSIRFSAPAVSRSFTSSRLLSAEAAAEQTSPLSSDTIYLQTNWNRIPEWAEATKPQLVSLGDLQPRPGTMKRAKRYGRGPGSGLGKTCGKGHKGQGQRKGLRKRGFEGGSTPFWRRMPKIGVTNATRYWKMLRPLTIRKVQDYVLAGRIDGSQLITMKTLVDSGCISKVEHGVKLLSGGLTRLKRPLHFQLTDCSEQARTLLESNNGSVHLVWFNKTTLRAHLHPLKFLQKHGRLPKATGVPPPKKAAKYGFVIEHVDY